jgi:hypothetical protein
MILKIFVPFRFDVAKWQHQAISYQNTFLFHKIFFSYLRDEGITKIQEKIFATYLLVAGWKGLK